MDAMLYIGVAFGGLLIVYAVINALLPKRICELRAPGLKSDRRHL